MGRRKETVRQADKLDQAAADAAEAMSANIAKIGRQVESFLLAAAQTTNASQRMSFFIDFGNLVDAQVKLGQTIAKMRGEIRQRISVHKTANTGLKAPKSAPNFDDEIPRITRKVLEKLGKYPPYARGEGERSQPLDLTKGSAVPADGQSSHPMQKMLEQWRAGLKAEQEAEERRSRSAEAEKG